MKILFIGGTGRLSSDVASLSLKSGHDVYLLTRGSSSREKFIKKDYHMIYGDICKKDHIINIMKNYSFDIIIDFLSYSVSDLERNLEIFNNKFKQYIFISSATVYENNGQTIQESKTKIGNKRWGYSYDKYLCEKFLSDYFKNKKNIFYTIIRPYVTYNETRVPYPIVPINNSFDYSILYRIKNHKPIPYISECFDLETTITNSRDFANGLVKLFDNKDAFNESFHITSDVFTSWSEVLTIFSNLYNVDLVLKKFKLNEFIDIVPEYEQILVGDKAKSWKFNNSKIKKATKNFNCVISLNEGLKTVYDFYSNEENQHVDYFFDGKMDKICKYHSKLKIKKIRNLIMYYRGYSRCFDLICRVFSKIKNVGR